MNEIAAFNATGIAPASEDAMPHSIEAEQQLLGAILTNNDVFDRVASIMTKDHFYDPVHARIYEVAAARISQERAGQPRHPQGLSRRRRGAEGTGRPRLPRPTGRGSDFRLCRPRLCPDHLRPRHPPRIDPSGTRHRRQGRQDRRGLRAQGPDRRGRAGTLQTGRAGHLRKRLPVVPARRHRCGAGGQRRLSARRRPCGRLHRACRSGQETRRSAQIRPSDPRRAALDGQDLAGHQHRLQHRQGLPQGQAARRLRRGGEWRRRRLLQPRDERRTTGRPDPLGGSPKCPPNRSGAAT
jgi:hypothetical protein